MQWHFRYLKLERRLNALKLSRLSLQGVDDDLSSGSSDHCHRVHLTQTSTSLTQYTINMMGCADKWPATMVPDWPRSVNLMIGHQAGWRCSSLTEGLQLPHCLSWQCQVMMMSSHDTTLPTLLIKLLGIPRPCSYVWPYISFHVKLKLIKVRLWLSFRLWLVFELRSVRIPNCRIN